MKVGSTAEIGATLVDNRFIDYYMAKANGEFVKVYLYLLRLASANADITIPEIADFFAETEGDVSRALNYWEKEGLLQLGFDPEGHICAIRMVLAPAADPRRLSPLPEAPQTEDTSSMEEVPSAGRTDPPVPSSAAPAGIAGQKKDERQLDRAVLQQLIFVAEQYFGHLLSPGEKDMLEYFIGDLGMSSDLVCFLLEYCIGKGHPSVRYIEKVARAWAGKGIRTVRQAKEETRLFGGDYSQIFKELGLSRQPAPAECRLMDKWLSEYGFSLDLIREACRRTLLQTSQPSLTYLDSILTSWKNSGAKTMDQVQKLDLAHESEKKKKAEAQPGDVSAQRKLKNSGQFNNYSHTDVDWNAVGYRIMQNQRKG